MKTFFSTLPAILTAALILWLAISIYQSRNESLRQSEEIHRLTLDVDLGQAQMEWNQQMRQNPQFDPDAQELKARLIQIRQAHETGKPVPPNLGDDARL
jgi:hypothetical protein